MMSFFRTNGGAAKDKQAVSADQKAKNKMLVSAVESGDASLVKQSISMGDVVKVSWVLYCKIKMDGIVCLDTRPCESCMQIIFVCLPFLQGTEGTFLLETRWKICETLKASDPP